MDKSTEICQPAGGLAMKGPTIALLWILLALTACAHMAIRGPVFGIIPNLRKPEFLCSDHRPMVAIVIDDIGRSPHDLDPFLALPIPITFSVFPNLPFSRQAIAKATRAGHEVLGHIPMEPIMSSVMEPDLRFLLVNDPADRIRSKLKKMLDSLIGIKGINNHMGSLFTQKTKLMAVVIRRLKQRGLFFLDSRTTSLTMAEATARQMHLPCLRRDVFLDDVRDSAAVEAMLDKLAQKAVQKGCALAIGHPFPETIEGIRGWLRSSNHASVRFVYASALLSCQGSGKDSAKGQ